MHIDRVGEEQHTPIGMTKGIQVEKHKKFDMLCEIFLQLCSKASVENNESVVIAVHKTLHEGLEIKLAALGSIATEAILNFAFHMPSFPHAFIPDAFLLGWS